MRKIVGRPDLFRAAANGILAWSAGSVRWTSTAQSTRSGEPPLLLAEIGNPVSDLASHSDSWNGTWADDDQVYTSSCNTLAFSDSARSNLAVHRITGTPPNIVGETINPMKQFGGWAEISEEDGARWKTGGLACINGALYLTVSRHGRPFPKPYQIQQSWDSTIIRSNDHGKTWSETPKLNHAIFPGRIFANPYFVQYGKDGADQYAYAIPNDGCWNNGNFMIMGRLKPNDWEFVHGFDEVSLPRIPSSAIILQLSWFLSVLCQNSPGSFRTKSRSDVM